MVEKNSDTLVMQRPSRQNFADVIRLRIFIKSCSFLAVALRSFILQKGKILIRHSIFAQQPSRTSCPFGFFSLF